MNLLLTMGPSLGLVMDTSYPRVGESGEVTFRAVSALGDVKWVLVDSDLPAEWDASLTVNGDEATLTTAEAIDRGIYHVTIRISDIMRVPVQQTFAIEVAKAQQWAWVTTDLYPVLFREEATPSADLLSSDFKVLLISMPLQPEEEMTPSATLVSALVSADIGDPIVSTGQSEYLTPSVTLVSAEVVNPLVTMPKQPEEEMTPSVTLVSVEVKEILISMTPQPEEEMTPSATLISAEIV